MNRRLAGAQIGSAGLPVTWRQPTLLDIAPSFTQVAAERGAVVDVSALRVFVSSHQVLTNHALGHVVAWKPGVFCRRKNTHFCIICPFYPLKNVNTVLLQWSEESWKLFLHIGRQDEEICVNYRHLP